MFEFFIHAMWFSLGCFFGITFMFAWREHNDARTLLNICNNDNTEEKS